MCAGQKYRHAPSGSGSSRLPPLSGAALLVVVALYAFARVSRTSLFWAAFILTRPLAATVGDYHDKPVAAGGLALSRFDASAVLIVLMAACILLLPQRPGRITPPGQPSA